MKTFNEFINYKFDNWFNGSKAVNKNGKPLIVYHGTNDEFDEFSPQTGYTRGIFFTSNKKLAKIFGSKVKSFYLRLLNPVIVDDNTNHWTHVRVPKDLWKHAYNYSKKKYGPFKFIRKEDGSLINNINSIKSDLSNVKEVTSTIDNINIIIFENRLGDGAIYKNIYNENEGVSDIFVVFKPEQIKSTSNKKFDINDPRYDYKG